ncbi:MAG TPA: DUF4215 domain-containing protein [Kofleriaceae bacterium]|nr:DUF4215 domain-containing protein [Kofleriaceae bacterium]
MRTLVRFSPFLSLAALSLAACAADAPSTSDATQAVITPPLPSLNLVLNAKTTIAVGPFSHVEGDVASSGAKGSVLFDVGATQGFFFSFNNVLANTVQVRTQASVGQVFGNDLIVDGTATSETLGLDPAALPPVPAGTPPTPGTSNVSVAANEARQLCPGQYGAISLAGNATLNLNGGVYQVTRLSLGDGARLEPSEPVVILVTGSLTTGTSARIAPSPQALGPMTAGDIRIELGTGATIGDGSTVRAHVLAPNGKLTAGNQVAFTGAAWARAIALGASDSVIGEGVFLAQAAAVPPPCNDHNACTTDTCVTSGKIAFCRNEAAPAGTTCDDGNPCNGAGTCDAQGQCELSAPLPAGASCSDGNACNGIETCDFFGICEPGTPPVIPGGGVCTLTHCGDGFVDPGEECDDGNSNDFDGCSNLCTLAPVQIQEIEPNEDGSVSVGFDSFGNDFSPVNADANGAFAQSTMIHGSIDPAGDEDVFAFDNLSDAPRTIRFELWSLAQGIGVPCIGFDTTLSLRTADGAALIQNDDANGLCSSLTFSFAPGQRLYAHVAAFTDARVLPDYVLVATYL